VAEVWMDEYKDYVYKRNPDKYKIDPGDLTKQLAIKEKNKCKPFKYFMEHVAPDMLERFPLVEPEPFAYGTVSVGNI
jgi:polypeptide N-acetylgalactosaminyltransferase